MVSKQGIIALLSTSRQPLPKEEPPRALGPTPVQQSFGGKTTTSEGLDGGTPAPVGPEGGVPLPVGLENRVHEVCLVGF